MEEYLRNLYKEFLEFDRSIFILDAKKYSTSLEKIKFSEKTLKEFYKNYYQPTFFGFLGDVKQIIFGRSVFDFILKNFSEDWNLWPYLVFLKRKRIIKVKRNGKIFLFKKEISKFIPPPKTEKDIQKKIERRLKVKIKRGAFVIDLFKKLYLFKVKPEWDQMPISQESAIFLTSKILENLPFYKKFLFIGDDDFISVILTLSNPNIECLVIDIDEELLECINFLAKKFNLKIETKKINIQKKEKLEGNFVGFLTNPVYTEDGVREFIEFGVSQLGKDGGIVFLELGDESIGKRFLFLQDFFTKKRLIINEMITGKIYYPWISLYKEDKEIERRLAKMVDKEIIQKSPKLGAVLYIFDYLPKKPKRVKLKKPIYAYL